MYTARAGGLTFDGDGGDLDDDDEMERKPEDEWQGSEEAKPGLCKLRAYEGFTALVGRSRRSIAKSCRGGGEVDQE